MEEININLPKAQFDELSNFISCETMATKGKVKGIKKVRGYDLVITGALGSGTGDGWALLMAVSVVPFVNYDGPTRTYKEKWPQPNYEGIMFWDGPTRWVFTGQGFYLNPIDENVQLSLF